MGYRLVALDIDGTIRSNEYPLSDRTRRAIALVREAGAVVTVATGRMFRSVVAATEGLGLKDPVVSYQGAHIADPTTGRELWHRPLTPQMAAAALEAVEPWGLDVMAYHRHRVYVARMTPWMEEYAQRNRVQVHVMEDLREMAARGPTRLVVVGGEEEVRRLETHLKAAFDSQLYVTRSLPHFCEMLHPESGKDRALAWLCDRLGIRQEEAIAFGNGYNDVPMLAWAGLGVAVQGAVPEAVQVADKVAPPIEQDGVAWVLEDLMAQGLIG